jgi:hypothetical protein
MALGWSKLGWETSTPFPGPSCKSVRLSAKKRHPSSSTAATLLIDVYLGDVRGDEARFGAYGNPPCGDPYFAESETPPMKELAQRIRSEVPDGARLIELIEGTWLCAPKAFRNFKRLILESALWRWGDSPAVFPSCSARTPIPMSLPSNAGMRGSWSRYDRGWMEIPAQSGFSA